ncbi:hypothetical protein [Paenibacillus anseongense]|nr:hypothetical protein [Paenibacillus anseongense]MEC0265151.1 hypothetical protein [Paenibacillus anseongense]
MEPTKEKKDYELAKTILTLATAVIGLVNVLISLYITDSMSCFH